ncbi:HD domain-containing protein [Actinoplanes sp. NBC_00393]|uniref:HD domain-containing protein n=1 Tax=Actinoplanes sp. NBC_00393 TaxID=2975953 RepID=UPI002E203623
MQPLPDAARELLETLAAPPRLVAHLRLVHDVAWQVTGWLADEHPRLGFDREAVLFGAATHDIGKVRHPRELSQPGRQHEPAGYELLLELGVPDRLARFAGTHGSWTADGVEVEDLLVSLADKVWKGQRVAELEQLVVDRLAAASGLEAWAAFLSLDDRLQVVAGAADARLAYQNGFPVL